MVTLHFETWHTWLRRGGHLPHNLWGRSLRWGFSPNRLNITLLWLFPVLCCSVLSSFFLLPTPSSNRAADIHALSLKWRGSAQRRSFLGVWWWVTLFGGNVPQKHPKRGVNRDFQATLPKSNPTQYIQSVQNLMTKLAPSTARRGWSTTAIHEIQHGWRLPSWNVT